MTTWLHSFLQIRSIFSFVVMIAYSSKLPFTIPFDVNQLAIPILSKWFLSAFKGENTIGHENVLMLLHQRTETA